MDHNCFEAITKSSGGNFWTVLAIAIWVYYAFVRRKYRGGWRQGGTLLATAMRLRSEGHKDLSTEILCSIALLHPRFAVQGMVEGLLQEELESPTHRASLILAYKSMHDQFPDNAGLSYKLAHLYHLDGRDTEAVTVIDQSVSVTADTDHWKARMAELRDTIKPAASTPSTDSPTPEAERDMETGIVPETETEPE